MKPLEFLRCAIGSHTVGRTAAAAMVTLARSRFIHEANESEANESEVAALSPSVVQSMAFQSLA
ncbi:MAG: hypothetical protein AAGJ83_07700 [Planctomycetota bacterium]